MKFLDWFTGKKKVEGDVSIQKLHPESKIPPHAKVTDSEVKPVTVLPISTNLQSKAINQKITAPLAKITELVGAAGKKKLGYWAVVFILINSILGSSLFYLPSQGVLSSGAASIIAWIIIFIIATWMMLYIGELITTYPSSGGTYEFCKRAYGRFGSFSAGWLIWLAGNFGMALNIVAAAEYFIPGSPQGGVLILRISFALVWIIALNFMAFRGIDAGTTMLLVFGVIATFVLLLMTFPSFIDFNGILQGTFKSPFNPAFMQPFFQGVGGIGFFAGLGLSLFLISEAFLGFETITYLANEVKEPKKLHKPLIVAMIICGVLMSLYIFSSLGTVRYGDYVQDARPFAVQALNTMGQKGQDIVVFGMYLMIIGAAAAWPITGGRLIQAMAKDKLFITQLAVLHPKHKSPHRAVYFQTLAISLFTFVLFRGYYVAWKDPYRTVYLIYVLLSLLVIGIVLMTVPILRRKDPLTERPFKAPFGTIGPIVLTLFFAVLVGNWIMIEHAVATTIISLTVSFIFVGVPFYFMVEMFFNPDAIRQMNEKLSFFSVLFERVFYPFSIRRKLLKEMGDIRGKVILEHGCSVGILTEKLAQRVGPEGKIIATDFSLHKVQKADKRTKNLAHVTVHHHPDLKEFSLPLTEKVDGIISVGMLSYMQKPEQILKSMAEHVKIGGEIVFLDFDKFFYIIPNVKWVQSDAQLIGIFKRAGFDVQVERKNGLLWKYINVFGVRV
ncbi:amino acid permease [Candidatus Woesearchaeota archaeon]|nr:amino acid permease [Candidatus Woesearchaeota archaeon]